MALSWQLLVVREFDSSYGKVARAVQNKKIQNVAGLWAGNANLLRYPVYLGIDGRRCRLGLGNQRLTGERYNLNFWNK